MYKEIAPENRHHVMANEAIRTEQETYTRLLSDEEVSQSKDEFARLSMQKNMLEERKKEIMKELRDEIKAVSTAAKSWLKKAIEKKELVTGTIYYIPNYEKGIMEMYDKEGDLVHSRKLYPEERQLRIETPVRAIK